MIFHQNKKSAIAGNALVIYGYIIYIMYMGEMLWVRNSHISINTKWMSPETKVPCAKQVLGGEGGIVKLKELLHEP